MNARASLVFNLLIGSLIFANVPAGAAHVVEPGTALQNNAFLSRPVTLLDFFVHNLNARALEIQREKDVYAQGYKSPTGSSAAADARYDFKQRRIYLHLTLTAIRMDDLWRPVCAKRATIFYRQFSLPERDWDDAGKMNLLRRYIGPVTQLDEHKLSDTIAVLLDSLVTMVEYRIVGENGLVKSVRSCYLDNKTGKTTHEETRR